MASVLGSVRLARQRERPFGSRRGPTPRCLTVRPRVAKNGSGSFPPERPPLLIALGFFLTQARRENPDAMSPLSRITLV